MGHFIGAICRSHLPPFPPFQLFSPHFLVLRCLASFVHLDQPAFCSVNDWKHMVVTSPEHQSMMKSGVIWMFFFHGTEYTLTKQSLVGRDAMWTVVSCSNTSFSFSVLCSVSMLSSSSSDFCNSTSEALDTLKIPWILTRTFTLTFELSPEAWGTTFWMKYWPAWEFQCTCLHTECTMTKTVQWKYAMRRKEHVQGPEYLPPLQVAGELRRKATDKKNK